ncbi:ATP-dependent DNA helicase RecG [Campylobacter sp. CCUG 57310]|uniref:ATP-dependent DNA helicase RecG n=1 Tax=Campylobacter sp. CCUG 57310 TaxID=2517362 RepID=UPI001566CE35|nr:ATP-dependent DNA helicase RecG [Campylobacter sp. CCUG 57310]QKF92468.1 ATP-dependent DNA helicase [Campylobacter sp. CCUG 57310]
MKFKPGDKEILNKIGVFTLLDLSLKIPKSFDDTTITQSPKDANVSIEVVIKNSYRQSGILHILAWCESWEQNVKIIIFNAKSWHFGAFKTGKQIYINGKCSFAFGSWQITNPKIITKINEIIPKYKLSLRDDRFKELASRYVTIENLLAEGLNESEAKFLSDLHKSDHNSAHLLENLDKGSHGLEILKFVEIYNYLRKLSAKKTDFASEKVETFDISPWIASLPFKLTDDQKNAIADIRLDLSGDKAKRRVVMGDVGSGKTIVILATALSVYPKAAIVMAPTSILAEQIYDEAVRLLPRFMNIKLVKSGEKELEFEGVNLIIGTHVLLYNELVKSPVVMIDEQHRFGSNQREKINQLVRDGQNYAHVIQFSATPIPRTLSMIQSSFVEFSFLKQMPFKKTIHSQILQSGDFERLLNHIRQEIAKNKQVVIVYPLVEISESSSYQSLSEAQDFWLKNFKNVFITHGKDRQKEQILREFRQSGDILLSTTVVEVGISLPRLSTIVVVGAERLGLATLHQLRGRVGRQGGEGFCFLFTKLKNPPERLREFCATLDGFEIAQIDLKNRQSGDILGGVFQHGATFEYYEFEENLTAAAKNRLEKISINKF